MRIIALHADGPKMQPQSAAALRCLPSSRFLRHLKATSMALSFLWRPAVSLGAGAAHQRGPFGVAQAVGLQEGLASLGALLRWSRPRCTSLWLWVGRRRTVKHELCSFIHDCDEKDRGLLKRNRFESFSRQILLRKFALSRRGRSPTSAQHS